MAQLTAGEIIWRINGDSSGFDKKVKASEKGAKKLGSTWKSVGAKIAGALAAIGLGKMVKGWVKSASQAEEVSNKFGVVFKSVAVEANKASANLAANYGMSTVKSKELLSATGDLLTGLGMSGESALETSISVNKLAADLASFQNIDVKQASDALTKGLLGERESMKSLGIVIQEVDVKRALAAKGQENLTGEA